MIGLNFLGRLLQLGLYTAGFLLAAVIMILLIVWAWRLSWALIARTWPGPAARLRARFKRPDLKSR